MRPGPLGLNIDELSLAANGSRLSLRLFRRFRDHLTLRFSAESLPRLFTSSY